MIISQIDYKSFYLLKPKYKQQYSDLLLQDKIIMDSSKQKTFIDFQESQ